MGNLRANIEAEVILLPFEGTVRRLLIQAPNADMALQATVCSCNAGVGTSFGLWRFVRWQLTASRRNTEASTA